MAPTLKTEVKSSQLIELKVQANIHGHREIITFFFVNKQLFSQPPDIMLLRRQQQQQQQSIANKMRVGCTTLRLKGLKACVSCRGPDALHIVL